MALLTVSTDLAATAELDDPDYRDDLRQWTSRPPASGDGVPPATAVRPGLRLVPLRDFDPADGEGMSSGTGRAEGAAYVVVFGIGYRPIDLLHGGEALSALLLAATAEGLSTAPLSDAVEVTWPRRLLRYLLSGRGEPCVVVRLGYVDSEEPPAARATACRGRGDRTPPVTPEPRRNGTFASGRPGGSPPGWWHGSDRR